MVPDLPDLPSIFKKLSRPPDQGFFFSPKIVRIGGSSTQNRPGYTQTTSRGSESLEKRSRSTTGLIITHPPTTTPFREFKAAVGSF